MSSSILSKTKAPDEETVFLAGAVGEPMPLAPEGSGRREKACWLPQWFPCLPDTEAKLVNKFQANGGRW